MQQRSKDELNALTGFQNVIAAWYCHDKQWDGVVMGRGYATPGLIQYIRDCGYEIFCINCIGDKFTIQFRVSYPRDVRKMMEFYE